MTPAAGRVMLAAACVIALAAGCGHYAPPEHRPPDSYTPLPEPGTRLPTQPAAEDAGDRDGR